ncbi:hypothetical protein SELMODRAFT_423675 [Selaginella moellendorffii]|uniref:Uncharacterized protein n=1 Tax=Selaginella moellendorffii TaxID=88036 RepID=D8SMH1_SELML|nr:hypothetical protein SELMODRAFT_423675 [Selaginella moellendorffii]
MEDEKPWVWNCVIRDYGMLGRVDCAREAFLQCPTRNFLSWKLLADAYAQKGHYWKVLEIEEQIPAVRHQLAPPPPSPASILLCTRKARGWQHGNFFKCFAMRKMEGAASFFGIGQIQNSFYASCVHFPLDLWRCPAFQGKKELKRLKDSYHGLHLSKTRGVPVTQGVSVVPMEATRTAKEPATEGVPVEATRAAKEPATEGVPVAATRAAKEPVAQGVAVTQGVPVEATGAAKEQATQGVAVTQGVPIEATGAAKEPATQGVPMEARAARELLEALYIKASFCVFGGYRRSL